MNSTAILAGISVLIGAVLLRLFWAPLMAWLIAVGVEGSAAGLLSFMMLLSGPAAMILALRARM